MSPALNPLELSSLLSPFALSSPYLDRLALYTRMLDLLPVGVTLADPHHPDLPLVYVNDRFCQMTGYAGPDVLGRNCRFLQGDEWGQPNAEKLRLMLASKKVCTVQLRNFRKDGSLFHNELHLTPLFDAQGQLEFIMGVQNDVTKHVLALRDSPHKDMLTGMPTRAVVLERINALLAPSASGAPPGPFDVMVMDLDDFHEINSAYGFAEGDACLKAVAAMLLANAPPGAVVGRLGGVQFLCAYRPNGPLLPIEELGLGFMEEISQPLQSPPEAYRLQLSAGTASFPRDGADAQTLVQKAKRAMHYARSSGVRYPLPFAEMLK